MQGGEAPSGAGRWRVGLLTSFVIAVLLSASTSATSYTDDFSTDPIGGGSTTSFTTGTADTGLAYTALDAGGGCDFLWNSTEQKIDIGSLDDQTSTTEKFTIESRDLKAFVFHSLWYNPGPDSYAASVTIVGRGPEPFTIVTGGPGSEATYSPSSGPCLVTEIEISSVDFYYDWLDDVSVELDVPGAAVYGDGQLIANGDSTPSFGDDTNMGTTPIGTPVDKTFTISSIGDASLSLTGSPYVQFSSNPSGDFSIDDQPDAGSIASGGSDTFTVRFNPSSEGVKTATVSIGNDSEANPYTFTVQGEGSGAPEIDVQRPASTSIADGGTDAQGSKSIGTQVTLSYTVENSGNAQLSVTGIASASPSNVTVDDISPTTLSIGASSSDAFTVKYTPTTLGAFSFELDVANNDSDESNYDITVSGTGIDTDPPDASDITLADADPTNAASVDFTVTFDESVTGVDTTDFVVDASGIAGASIDTVSGGGTTWTVSVNTGTGDGTLSIDLTDDDSIEDGSGNPLGGSGAANGDFTAGSEYTIDKTPPSVPDGLLPAHGAYANTSTPTLSWDASTDTGGSGLRTTNTYRYQVSGPLSKDDYTANTNYTPTLSVDGVYSWKIYARDNAGNNSDWSEANTLTVDTEKPDVTIDQAMVQADPTNSSPVVFEVEFDEPINDATFTNADVSVGGTATTGTVTVAEVAPNDKTTFEVSIVVTGDGTVEPTIPAGGVEDLAGNTNNVSTSTDNSITVDTDPPGVTSFALQDPATSPTNADVLVFRVTFDEDVSNVDTDDFDVNSASTAFVDTTTQVTPDNVYDVTVRGGDLADFNGTVNLDLAPGVEITDYAGNPLPAASEPGVDETYTVDNAGPNVTIDQAGGQADPTNASPVTFSAVFDEPIDDATFTDADVTVGGTATTGAVTVTEIAPNDDTTFEVSVAVSGDGTVEVTIPAGGIEDALGNANSASTSTDNSVTYDGTRPNVTIDQAVGQPDPTGASPVTFTAVFDEPIDDATFTSADVTVGGTATTGAVTVTEIAPNDGTTFEVEIVVTGDGTVEPTISAGGVEDPAGNTNKASTSTDNSVTVDTDPPEATGVTENPSVIADADAGDQTFTLTIDYDEPMDTDVAPTVSFPGIGEDPSSTIALDPASDWTSNTTYVARFDVADENETIDDIDVRVTGARDLAGNAQAQYDEADVFSIDTENPWISSLTSTTANGYYDVGAAIDVTMTFSESVTLTGVFPQLTVGLDSGAVNVPLAVPAGVASTNGTYTVGAGENSCDLNVVEIAVIGPMRDVAGNALDTTKTMEMMSANNLANNKDITVDTTEPTITWAQGFPSGTQDVGADCSLEFPIEVRVTDNCCIDADDVGFTLVGPAGVSATETLIKTQVTGSRVDITGTVTVSDLTDHPGTVDLDIDAQDCTGHTSASSGSVTVDDASAPTYDWIVDLPDANPSMDEDCSLEFPIEILVKDNCCLDVANVTVTVSDPADVTVAHTLTKTQEGSDAVRIEGDVTVSALTDGSATVTVDVRAEDCRGNVASTSDAVTVIDEAPPTVSGFAVTPTDGLVDDDCEEVVAVAAVVRDACCIDAGDVVVTPSVTNASLKDNQITVTQTAPNEVTVSGTIVVCSLTGCPATIEIRIDGTDCAGNHDEWTGSALIEDDIVPVVGVLRVDEHVVVGDCCEATVTFDGTVTDNCCITPAGIVIEVTHPSGNATVTFDPAEDVVFTQSGQGRVDFAGEIHVRCVTSCPAIVGVTVNAEDCCGNRAAEVTSTADPGDPTDTGHVVDETAPAPRDDPRQDVVADESAVIDPLVVVRADSLGVYRLTLREDTPVRIDVLANDADNCSCEDCEHAFDRCGGCGECPGCCGAMFVDEIVSGPAHGTATIEQAGGDCTGGSVIRYAPDRGHVGPDEFAYRTRDACGNVSSEMGTVRLQTIGAAAMEDVYVTVCADGSETFELVGSDAWIDGEEPDRIAFTFEVVGAPAHGVLSGELGEISYTASGEGGASGTATVELTYTPAAGFTGHDGVTMRFADPFGRSTDAWVDIEVVGCAAPADGTSVIPLGVGEVLSIIVPSTFAGGAEVVTLVGGDGMAVSGSVTAAWDEAVGRFVLRVGGEPLGPGRYVLTIPLGNGETVELTIEVRGPDRGSDA